MRTIKFRAFSQGGRLMFLPFTIVEAIQKKYHLEDLVLQQFTGLLDKNGKEIYEGDIVKYNNWTIPEKYPDEWKTREVIWQRGKARFIFGEGDLWGMIYPSYCMEVIGNIYESPELLTQ